MCEKSIFIKKSCIQVKNLLKYSIHLIILPTRIICPGIVPTCMTFFISQTWSKKKHRIFASTLVCWLKMKWKVCHEHHMNVKLKTEKWDFDTAGRQMSHLFLEHFFIYAHLVNKKDRTIFLCKFKKYASFKVHRGVVSIFIFFFVVWTSNVILW